MIDSIKYLLTHPHESGFTIFVIGVLFLLSVYHFLLYFQNKDKVYLYYSLYTFLILINQSEFILNGTNSIPFTTYKNVLSDFHSPIVWSYNTIYFIFGFTFLNLKKYSKKWYLFIFRIVYLLLSAITITIILFIITGKISFIHATNGLIIPSLYLFGIIAYYSLFTIKMPLKNYIIIGSFILYLSSFISEYLGELVAFKNNNATTSIFYIGVIVENIIFSLGLGRKQKRILEEKNESQNKLINQLKENEKLRSEIHKQLEKQVKIEQLEKEKAKSDTELLTLKMSSLQNQMKPHFIFNSLNAIKLYIIDSDKENAVYYLNKFSKLIRKILAVTREKEITLTEEIETLKLYIEIENIRFNNEIIATFIVDKRLNLDKIKIPSLIFQPFVENAIWHGLSLKKGIKKIIIKIDKVNNTLVKISIKDNGIGRKKSAKIKSAKIFKTKSVGIKLSKERLSSYFINKNFTLDYVDLVNNKKDVIGTEVIIKLPIKK